MSIATIGSLAKARGESLPLWALPAVWSRHWAPWLLGATVVFLFVYGIQFSFLPTYTSRLVALAGIVWLPFGLWSGTRLYLTPTSVSVFVAFFAYFVWTSAMTILYEAQDVALFSNALLILVQVFAGGLFIAWLINRLGGDFEEVLFTIQVATVLQAVFVIVYFVDFPFRELTLIYVPQISNIDYQTDLLRSRGLTNGGGATLSLVQSIGLLGTVFLLTRSRSACLTAYLLLSSVLLVVSIGLSGRTGLFVAPFVLALGAAYVLSYARIPRQWAVAVIFSLLFVAVTALSFRHLYTLIMGDSPLGLAGIDQLVGWVSSAFIENGQLGSHTIDVLLQEHWHFPTDLPAFLFGDPRTWTVHRVDSDIGLVRRIYGSGLVGMLLGYAWVALMFVHLYSTECRKSTRAFVAILCMWLFLTEMKEPFLLKFELLSILAVFFFHTMFPRRYVVRGRLPAPLPR